MAKLPNEGKRALEAKSMGEVKWGWVVRAMRSARDAGVKVAIPTDRG